MQNDRARRLHPRSLAYLSSYLDKLTKGRLWLKVIIGMVLGVATGIVLGPTVGLVAPDTASAIGNWLALPGRLFLLLIQMIVIPLVFASVIRGLTSGGSLEQLRSLGLRVTLYFVFTTTVAISIGLAVALIIKPGHYIDSAMVQQAIGSSPAQALPTTVPGMPGLSELPQKLITILPSNPLTSMVEGQMLQVVLFAIIFGVALVMMPASKSKPMLDVLGSLLEVCMTVVRVAMRLAPYAVFGLMTQLTTKIGLDALLGMAVYVGTVLLGLALLLGFYLAVVLVVGRTRPIQFLSAAREVMLLAFSTSSSAAVLPVTMKTAQEKLHIRSSVAQFVIPLGATVNMDGTALYQGVAAIFLAQVFGVDIGTGGMLLIIITAVGASIGAPATPGVGIVILAMVLESANIPVAGIALLLGVDRVLDMSRTSVNVCGDLAASTVMDRWLPSEDNTPAGPINRRTPSLDETEA
ncbi:MULTISPECIES: dicarboxylate/amino acid:cation symporter [Oleiagrimonas]|uniref:Dicarboxylate/amino acid:cation symporter n=1 Tax=Oleiagrimonas citrea TaxID=1665687 RepID=A0A846ZQU1_9GAMM|nr:MULTISPECIES: dicarboxylate/amino acid:cation symporter [Oleiagrimonas]NKZ39801.1 dicarboxylate/amino acid:cation symporter [Oleiagrimonas citrea]RAP57236.1 dicarboxylate/amino acid:cation symporter [Oleiagrimonas sp. MCCC 1A03011]